LARHRVADRSTRGLAGPLGALALVALALVALALVALLAGCVTATPSASPSSSLSPSPTATGTPAATATPTPLPTATPEPALSLDLPAEQDARQVSVRVEPAVPADGDGELVVTVTSLADTRVEELVLRWSTDLGETLLLAPFRPSEQRLAPGAPLVQPWTKWVVGPGEQGEPAGTTSLGWGPLLPGATLTIPLQVTRRAPGPVSFDLQVLAGEAVLSSDGGEPTELRISVP
jgi:hypothetical protein